MEQSRAVLAVLIIAVVAIGGVYSALYLSSRPASDSTSNSSSEGVVQVVAAENFWGNLASQLGGSKVHVVSIVTDPNADPHEYSSNSATARAIANASLVIVNGAGYDQWALSLIAAENNPHQIVLNVQQLLGLQVGVNPHFWYSPYYVNDTVKAVYQDFVFIDSGNAGYYRQQYAALNASLGEYNARIHEIAAQFGGTKVAATENIFEYLANATRLNLVSPLAFMQAVAEGNDPPASSVALFQQQLENKSVSVLVYNEQTITPLTQNIKALAAQENIPTVAVTETIQPSGVAFQTWMNSELISLQNALNANALGH